MQKFKRITKLMGSRFDLTVVAKTTELAYHYLDCAQDEISRIENFLSSFKTDSLVSIINKNAGIQPVQVDDELFQIIQRCQKVSELTQGVFDITYASMDTIWKFDGSMKALPSKEALQASIEKVNFKHIIVDPNQQTVFLKEKGMKISFGGIGKGYAADKTKSLMQQMGVQAGIINASGDLAAWGKQPDGTPWKIGLTNPLDQNKTIAHFEIHNSALITSGNYEKYTIIDNIKYTHIINCTNGMPATGMLSVSIFCTSAELADALGTTVFILGVEKGLALINSLKGIEALLIDDKGKIYVSNNLKRK